MVVVLGSGLGWESGFLILESAIRPPIFLKTNLLFHVGGVGQGSTGGVSEGGVPTGGGARGVP